MNGQDNQEAIGRRLRAVRAVARIEIGEVAAAIGVRRRVVERWERGEAAPCLHHFKEMLTLYGAPSHEVLFGEPLYALTGAQARELVQATSGASAALRTKLRMMLGPAIRSDPDQ